MSDMTMTLQPAIGLKQLNTIGSNPRIGVANSRMGRNATMDEDAAKRRAHLGGDATYAFLHKHPMLRYAAKTQDWYDSKNEQFATQQYNRAVALSPDASFRQEPLYAGIGVVHKGIYNTLSLMADVTGVCGFAADIIAGVSVAVIAASGGSAAPVAGPVGMAALGIGEVFNLMSAGLSVEAAQAHSEYADYLATRVQDGVGSKEAVLKEYEEADTENLSSVVSAFFSVRGAKKAFQAAHTLEVPAAEYFEKRSTR